jgi:hypothetical protein
VCCAALLWPICCRLGCRYRSLLSKCSPACERRVEWSWDVLSGSILHLLSEASAPRIRMGSACIIPTSMQSTCVVLWG